VLKCNGTLIKKLKLPEKQRPCQLRPGAWCGGVVYADQELPRSFITQNHWYRLLMTLEWMLIQAERNVAVPRQSVLEKRGSLVFASIAYPFMVPYLKKFTIQWKSGA
jgi:hypothetical protein